MPGTLEWEEVKGGHGNTLNGLESNWVGFHKLLSFSLEFFSVPTQLDSKVQVGGDSQAFVSDFFDLVPG